ncbi:dedicator of cytokinesis protein 1 isoform X2 [Aricia agestis]|uniref:dedicator of cytokinesis protein 1 isoform X2 n=1 Tax=Aricia agestis TaxID=91739 RepID=UPI001C202022|nr:dedicator of cytokinesis protein 1 isoform X2 [Aricia agestis]
MTVWRKLENEDCYAVAIYNFNSSSHLHLALEVGELVHIVRETRNWYWGSSLRREAKGAFPKNYVTVRETNVDKCGETVVASAGGGGVVHDIAVTLREWLQHWKQLYLTNDDRFTFMELSMRALLALRAQAASSAIPQDELRRVARTAIFTIDKGNRSLGMELAIRTVNGQLVDPLITSTFKLNGLHDEANSRIDKNMETTPSRPISQTPTARTYTVVGKVTNFVCRVSVTSELSLALHDSSGNKLTESVLLRWPPPHLAAVDLHMRPTFVFTDLSSDITKKIFLVCHVVRLGTMEPQNIDHRRSSMCSTGSANLLGAIRRPCGVAVTEVTLSPGHDTKEIQLPFYPCEKENMDSLLKKVIANRDPKDQKQTQGLWLDIQLVEGDMKQIQQENAHLVARPTAVARKMGFPEVILPGDARNDLYVTLVSGAFSRGGKSSDRNIELVARVVDKNGKIIPGVISRGAGMPLVNEYTSIVYYHDDRPRWQEVFKVCLNIEEFKEDHIVFFLRHRSSNEAKDRAEKHFALAYLPLMQREGTTTPDKAHNLAVYKIEYKKTSSTATTEEIETEASAACLGLWSHRDKLPAGADKGLTRGPLALIPRDTLTVETKLCSTKLTQREEILGVLKWSTHHSEGTLRAALRRLLRVPNDELVKFLQDILDALFCILTQVDEDQEDYTEESYAVLVLDCLLLVLSLVADHKYQHFQPVLHVYIDQSFCDALAYEKLISIMVWTISSAEAGEAGPKRLLQCMKCLESLVRLLVRSRQLRAALGAQPAPPDLPHYCPQLKRLLEALVWLMRCGDHALTCQGSALKYLPHAMPHMIKIYPDTELSEYTVLALEALPRGRLSNQRLHALLELARGPLGSSPGPRAKLLPHLAWTLRNLLRAPAELDPDALHKSRSVDKAARLLGADTARLLDHTQQQQVMELCVETLGEVVSLLARDDVGPVEADRGELARCLLPTVLRIAAAMMRDRGKDDGAQDDPLLRKLICVLLDMVRQMSEEQYIVVMRSIDAENSRSTGVLVTDALALMMALLQRPVFRSYWADMLHLQHHVMLHACRLLALTLRENLRAAEDDAEALATVQTSFQDWFSTVCAVASSPPLQLESLPASRRQRALALYGDVRRSAATLLADTWKSLGDYKRLFIPQLVGPLLEVSFLRDEEVRNTTIPLFFDMMQTEYNRNAENGEANMRTFETELIDKVDLLAEAGRGDAAWRARLAVLCGGLCAKADSGLQAAGGALVAAAARQLDALLQYRAAPHHQRVQLVTRVLRFYEHIERPHMYIRYVHRLADMHCSSQHWAEAGLTLQLHAKLLEWSDAPLPTRLRHPTVHTHKTHLQLKMYLYEEVARLLDEGRQWELAVRALQELVRVCEQRASHTTLAKLHEQLSRLYRAPIIELRMPATYFRVKYLGRGFPDHLRVPRGFVYRGNECEMLQSFKERMLDEWPDAEVLLKLDEPGEDVTDSDGQYLQINTVAPLMSEKWHYLLECGADEQVVRYYEHNDVSVFEFSRPFHRPEDTINGNDVSGGNEFGSLWLERTEIEISDTLPGILRWFPVVSSRTYWVSPLEVAVETMTKTNRDLKHAISEARNTQASLNPLCMRLQGILDAGVQGGLDNYEKAFMTAEYAARHPEHETLLTRLKELVADQLPLLQLGLEVHASRTTQRELHAHLMECFKNRQRHVHQRYGRRKPIVELEPETPEVQLRSVRDSVDLEPRLNKRVSDVSSGNESTPKSKFKLNSAISWTRNSSTGTLTPRKKRGRKSEGSAQSSASQWYTSATNGHVNVNIHSPIASAINSAFSSALNSPVLGNHNNNYSLATDNGNLRELRQELVTERPPRSEVERDRRLSQRTSFITNSEPPSNRDSLGTTDSNQDDEEPPPLPLKQSQRSVEEDQPTLPARHSYDLVLTPRTSYLHRRPMNSNNERAPTPPPKKRNQVNSS